MYCREIYKRDFSPIAEERIRNYQCPNCGKPKDEWDRRTDWRCCSKECTGDFWAKHVKILDWSVVRSQAFKRDNYICKMCKKRFVIVAKHPDYKGEEYADSSKLIGDHITPIAVGGSEFDLDNIQTLCFDCNKIKTKQDMAVIAKYRRIEKQQLNNQVLIE